MNISKNGIEMIKDFEGLKLEAYKAVPSEEHYTIGYGHYSRAIMPNEKITKEQAEQLLMYDVRKFVEGVDRMLTANVNQNQFDALVSFAYNVGLDAFRRSTLLDRVNHGLMNEAGKEFERWNKSGGKVLKGLVTRREKERELFLKPVPKPKATTEKHTIRLGETLSGIAHHFKTTEDNLLKLNPSIKNRHRIFAGQNLKVPKK